MNVENLFVKNGDQMMLGNIVERCLSNPSTDPGWELPSSYNTLLEGDPKRKVAISPSNGGWFAIVESKEVVDFGMAKSLSDELGGMAVIIQVSDVTGEVGCLSYAEGKVMNYEFGESANDPLNDARSVLKKLGIPYDLMMFKEVVQLASQGWMIKHR
jgi:hypothetical protein